MKKLFILLMALHLAGTGYTQRNANDAKAAYLLAEESFGKSDYKSTLDYLEQVKTALGTTNCKVLYLQIMATREYLPKNAEGLEKTLALISAFEKSPDYATFNEEKVLEVSKLKLTIRNDQKALLEGEATRKANAEKAFNTDLHSAGPFGVSLDELDKTKPTWKVKSWKSTDIGAAKVYYDGNLFKIGTGDFPFAENKKLIISQNPISGIVVVNDKIVAYLIQFAEFDRKKELYSGEYEGWKGIAASFLSSYKIIYNLPPSTRTFTAMGHLATQYDMRKGDCGVRFLHVEFPKGTGGLVKLVQMVYCDPSKQLDALIK